MTERTIILSAKNFNRLTDFGKRVCYLCGKGFEIGDKVIRREKAKPYRKLAHKSCWENSFV